jgi:glycine cleavage system H protein
MGAEALRFSKDHLWVKVEGDVARMGITEHAQRELGDVVFIGMPDVGKKYARDEVVGSIESVKTTSDIFTPVSGEVVEINAEARDTPDMVNADPMGKGWLFRIRLSAPAELQQLMDLAAYTESTKA